MTPWGGGGGGAVTPFYIAIHKCYFYQKIGMTKFLAGVSYEHTSGTISDVFTLSLLCYENIGINLLLDAPSSEFPSGIYMSFHLMNGVYHFASSILY